jgi:hypothetical protein
MGRQSSDLKSNHDARAAATARAVVAAAHALHRKSDGRDAIFFLRSVVGAPWPISLADFPGRFEIAQP